MTKSWILVANSSKAQLFAIPRAKLFNGGDVLSLIDEFEHPQSRLKDHDLISDKQGKPGNNENYEGPDPKLFESEEFARELAHHLEQGRLQNKYDDLIIIAAPHFHGVINKFLNNNIKNKLSLTIDKDYTSLNAKELINNLKTYM